MKFAIGLMLAVSSVGVEPPATTIPECRVKFIDQVILASERAGIVATLAVREGSLVKAGDVLVVLQDNVLQARYAFAKAQADSDVKIRDASKAAEVAAAEHQIAVDAIRREPNAVARTELLRLKLAAERAALQVEEAELEALLARHRASEAKAELEASSIRAPWAGLVVRTFKSRGEAVQLGDPVLELVNPDRLRVEGYLPVVQRGLARPGATVQVRQQLADDTTVTLDGRLAFVDVSVEPVTQSIRFWAEVPNPRGELLAGLSAELRFPALVAKTPPKE